MRYDVGGADDPVGMSGLAHLLEHLLFKGSTSIGTTAWAAERFFLQRIDAVADSLTRPPPSETDRLRARLRALEDSARTFVAPNEFSEILARNGARGLNATTDADATTYVVELPANRIELWFALEADRMGDPVFREFYAERDVVMEERRLRVEDQPGGRLEEALLAAAFPDHPYGAPVVGTMEDLRSIDRADVVAHHARHYRPEDAVVAIVGDLSVERVRDLAERYLARVTDVPSARVVLYGGSGAGDSSRRPASVPEGPRRVHVPFDAAPQIRIAWPTVDATHPDAPALTVLASILAGGATSRLYRRLVLDERVALSVSVGGGPGQKHPGLLTAAATPRAPHGNDVLEDAILEEIARIAAEPPTSRELEAVRNSVEAGEVERLASSLGLALQLAASESLFGDWRRTFRSAEALRAVTREDVSRVARTYLQPESRIVATLSREGLDGGGGSR